MQKEKTTNINPPKVSVVIPMYNCEQFIPEILYMFKNQSFEDFEVICVIDGATDGTEDKTKKFCELDDRFRYVVRENGGAGAARNTGMDLARGKYIVFCDADDVYSSNYLRKLYETAEGNDVQIAFCGAETYDYIAEQVLASQKGFNKAELLEDRVYSTKKTKHIVNMVDVQICNRMYLLDFLKESGLTFSETKSSNDLFFSKATMACADRIAVVHDNLLLIRRFINRNSISSTRGMNSHLALRELQKIYRWMKEHDLIKYYISDYFQMFEHASGYEVRNGVNQFFTDEMARVINCEEPWKYLTGQEIMKICSSSLTEKGDLIVKVESKNADAEEKEKVKKQNEVIKHRNEIRKTMREMIKKRSSEAYARNLDDPESKSPARIVEEKKSLSESPAVSVVIPMFNCADYVNDVLNMFAVQTFTDFEVICVIDGATDDTEKKVSEFCKKDTRFRYIVQENMGAGGARNTGIDLARGRYIIFSDADDEYSPDYLRILYETALLHDAQIVVCRYNVIDKTSNIENVEGFDNGKFYENIPYSHFGVDNLFVSFKSRVTNKLYNLKFVKDNGLRFSTTRVANDTFFVYSGLSVADRIFVLNDVLLKYRKNHNIDSVTSKRVRNQRDALEVTRQLYKWLKDHSLLEYHEKDYMRRVSQVLLWDGSFEVTPAFISDLAHMINAEEPWVNMNRQEVFEYLREGLLAENASRKAEELNGLNTDIIEADKELSFFLSRYRNRIHTAKLLRQVSNEAYGKAWRLKTNTAQNDRDDYRWKLIGGKNKQIKGKRDEKSTQHDLFVAEHFYFVIDSHNLGTVRSNLYGYTVHEGHFVFSYDDLKGERPGGDGRYVYVERKGDTIKILQDYIGSYGLYLFEKDGYWALSNSFLYLADYLKTDWKLTFNKVYADTFMIKYMTPLSYRETMINEISRLDRRAQISIDVSLGKMDVSFARFKEKSIPIDTGEGIDILDAWYDKWVDIIRNAVTDFKGNVQQDMSGGFDTRMILPLFLDDRVDASGVSFYSHKDTLRNHIEDYSIASIIADLYGIELNKEKTNDKVIRHFKSVRDTVAVTVYTRLCFHKQFSFETSLQLPINLVSSGHSFRSLWRHSSLEEFISMKIERSAKKGDLSGLLAPFADEVSDKVRQDSKLLSALYEEENNGSLPTKIPEIFRVNTRIRLHSGLCMTGMNIIHMDALLDEMISRLKPDGNIGDENLLPALICTRYAGELTDIPIEGMRFIKPETKAYAEELCEKYPRKNKTDNKQCDMASASDKKYGTDWDFDRLASMYGVTREAWDLSKTNAAVSDNDAEMIVQRAFLSPTIRNAFISLYGEELYDAVFKSPEKIDWHPFRHWHAALGIGMIKHITDNSGIDKKETDVIESLFNCAEEVDQSQLDDVILQIEEKKSISGGRENKYQLKKSVKEIISRLNIHEKPENCVFFIKNRHLGDIVRTLPVISLYRSYYKTEAKKKFVVLTTERFARFTEIIPDVDETLILSSEELEKLERYCSIEDKSICIYPDADDADKILPVYNIPRSCAQKFFGYNHCHGPVEIPENFGKSTVKETDAFINRMQLDPLKTLVLIPDSGSSSSLDIQDLSSVVEFYKRSGYRVLLNAFGTKQSLTGTEPISPPADVLLALIQRGTSVIGVQCGMTDICQWMELTDKMIKVFVLKTDRDKIYYQNRSTDTDRKIVKMNFGYTIAVSSDEDFEHLSNDIIRLSKKIIEQK